MSEQDGIHAIEALKEETKQYWVAAYQWLDQQDRDIHDLRASVEAIINWFQTNPGTFNAFFPQEKNRLLRKIEQEDSAAREKRKQMLDLIRK
jgi:hypothetical protein